MSQSGVYSESKMLWWLHRDGGLPEAPKQVQLILSDLCQQDCSFCAYRMSGYTSNELFMGDSQPSPFGTSNPKRWIDTDRALKLISEIYASGALSIQFTGGGEPTVHSHHEMLFEHALCLSLRCSLVSNGVRWSGDLIARILPGFDWVRVSIDAGNEASYRSLRKAGKYVWEKVWRNVAELSKAIAEQKTHTTLGVGFVVTPESWNEIRAFTERARDYGAHNVRFTAMFSTENETPFVEIYDKIKDEIASVRQSFESSDFTINDNFGSRFEDLKQHSPDYSFCSYQFYTAYIGGDLKAYRCCVLAYNKRGLVEGGDLTNRRFDEFWKSQQRKDDMRALDAHGCERCQFNVKNRQMLYILGDTASDTSPRHMEWP